MKETGKISRRGLLQGVGAAAAVGALGSARSAAEGQQLPASPLPGSGGKPRALALIGDRYHNQNEIRIGLNRIFRELGISIDYTTNYYDLSAELLKPYQLFICYRDNMIWPGGYEQTAISTVPGVPGRSPGEDPGVFPAEKAEYWITEDQGKAVKDFVSNGGSFYSYHNNAFVSRSSKNYREVQGGWAQSHPPLRPFKVKIVNKNHPITQGVEDFMVNDEQHYLVYDKDPKNILLQSENLDSLTFPTALGDPDNPSAPVKDPGTGSVSGWAHDFGKGRVVFTAMGHTLEAMWQPEYVKIQKNAVRWLLRMS